MILYLDTSALLKLYVEEPGATQVRAAVRSAPAIATHLVAYAEVRSGFAKALRLRRITRPALLRYQRDLDTDWENLSVLQPDERLVRRAADLIDRFALRAYDGVHLAAAESLLAALPPDRVAFLSFDAELNSAAAALGMRVEP